MKLLYIAYDSRYTLDEDRASVLFTERSKKRALKMIKDYGNMNVLVEYEEIDPYVHLKKRNQWVIY